MTIHKEITIEKVKNMLPQKGASFAYNLTNAFFLAMVVCTVFLSVLTLYLADYQNSLPADVATRLLKAYNEADSAVFAEYNDALPNAFADDYRFAAYIDLSFPKEQLYYCKGTAKHTGETVYEFKARNIHIATLTTKEIESTTFFGFRNYEVVSFVPEPIEYYTIFAPIGTRVMIDGSLLHQKYPPTLGYAYPCFESVSASNISEIYIVPDYDALGALSIKNASSEDYIIEIDEENDSVLIAQKSEQTAQGEIIEFVDQFVKEYLIFTTKKNAPRGLVLKMTHPQTEFYKILQQYSNVWRKEYRSGRFNDIEINEIKQYSPSEYSCNVSLSYLIVRDDGAEKNIDFAAVFYLTNRNGTWLAVDMELKKR